MRPPRKIPKILRGVLIAVVYLAIWQGAALLIGKSLLLPSPIETLVRLVQLMGGGSFWLSALYSLLRIVAGYALAVLFGVLLAILCAASRWADVFLRPLRSIVKATPVTSFIILVLLWLTKTMVPLFISFLMVLPIVWMNILEGIRATDRQLLEMGRVFRFGAFKTLRLIYFPSVKPHLIAACTTGLGFAWKAGISAEVIANPALSIGRNLYESKLYLETTDLFAWTALVVILSIALEHLVVYLLNRKKDTDRKGKQP